MIIEAKVRLPPMTTTLAHGPVPTRHAIVKLVCNWVPPNLSEKHGCIDIFDQPGVSLSDTVVAGVKASEKAFMFLLASSFPAGLLRYLCPADQKNGHCCLVVGGDSNYKEFVLDDEHPVQG